MVVLVYVDDLILTGNDPSNCTRFKTYLDCCFHIKDLRKLRYFLGIEVARTVDSLFLCQRKYTLDILTEFGMLRARPVTFPMEQNLKLTMDSGVELQDAGQYGRLETILLLWHKDEVFVIENRSPAKGAYSEGLLNAKLTQ
ncbi:hypothetical protein CRG98_049996, partial [Punica granatum]